jgi:hypothetical protein
MGFGVGPAGLGTPVTTAAPPDGPAGSRFIDPAVKDYAQDPSTGQQKQMPKVRQQVLLALTTLRGSASTLRDFGARVPRKMGDRFQAEVTNAVKAALQHLTDTQKVIRIDSIKAIHGRGGRAEITVAWSDLTTGKPDRLTI